MTVVPLEVTDMGPGSTRYWIGILAVFQIKGSPSFPKAGRLPTAGPPTTSGPPAVANGAMKNSKISAGSERRVRINESPQKSGSRFPSQRAAAAPPFVDGRFPPFEPRVSFHGPARVFQHL